MLRYKYRANSPRFQYQVCKAARHSRPSTEACLIYGRGENFFFSVNDNVALLCHDERERLFPSIDSAMKKINGPRCTPRRLNHDLRHGNAIFHFDKGDCNKIPSYK